MNLYVISEYQFINNQGFVVKRNASHERGNKIS